MNRELTIRLAKLTLSLPVVKKALLDYAACKFADVDARDAGLTAGTRSARLWSCCDQVPARTT